MKSKRDRVPTLAIVNSQLITQKAQTQKANRSREASMSKTSRTPLADAIIQSMYIDHNQMNNNHSKYDEALAQNGKYTNGLPGLFTEIDINGTHGTKGHYFDGELKRPYSLYDGKWSSGSSWAPRVPSLVVVMHSIFGSYLVYSENDTSYFLFLLFTTKKNNCFLVLVSFSLLLINKIIYALHRLW